jgi:hypothetical protein
MAFIINKSMAHAIEAGQPATNRSCYRRSLITKSMSINIVLGIGLILAIMPISTAVSAKRTQVSPEKERKKGMGAMSEEWKMAKTNHLMRTYTMSVF